jgi:topoisomerase IV subunit A
MPGISSDKTIDALYAFTDCEVSISPNACIIEDDKPHFIGVSDILKKNADQTVVLLKLELEIKKSELEEQWHFASLEKIFIEERIYKDKAFEDSKNMDEAVSHIDMRLEPWKPKLRREVTRDDILRLMEIKMGRILKFNTDKANDNLLAIEDEIAEILHNIENIVPFTIAWYNKIKSKYGKGRERKTEIRSFENIVATKVVVANEKLYVDYEEGFMGTSLKKSTYVCDCSDIDEIIVFRKDGTYFVTKVTEKAFVGKNLLHVAVFKKDDKRTIYNLIYRDGKAGATYMKRFAVTGVTRDKEYNMTQGTAGSRIQYFSVNPNGEAEVLRVTLKPKPRIKKLIFDIDMAELAIKGRSSIGNMVTRSDVHKISLKEKGASTLGGRKIYYDPDVNRLNADNRGNYLGDFQGDDRLLVITKAGEFELFTFDLENHFPSDMLFIEKFNAKKTMSVVYWDNEQQYYYVKRFQIEEDTPLNKPQNFIGEMPDNKLISITWVHYPRLELEFGGKNSDRENEIVEVSEFISIKSFKAKGKRLTNYEVKNVKELEPVIKDEDEREPLLEEEPKKELPNFDDVPFEINRAKTELDDDKLQMSLFD